MKKRKFVSIAIFLLLCLFLFIFLYVMNEFKEYEIKEKTSFSETANVTFSLTNEEKGYILEILQSNIVENDNLIGFNCNTVGTDLYYANSLVEISKTLYDKDVNDYLKSALSSLTQTDLKSLSILNLIYYVNICEYLDMPYNVNEVFDCLENFYDSEAKLFFLNDINDTINIKIVITALCCKTIPSTIKYDKFDILTGIKSVYNNYNFTTDQAITFYNSGGDILYCYSVLGLIDDSIISKNKDWFERWQSYYESIQVDSIESALAYSEFYNVAVIFDKNYSKHKIQMFYDNLSIDVLSDDIDYYMINNSIKNAENFDNILFNSQIIVKLKSTIATKPIFETNIDLLNTVYGVLLAKNCEFEIDNQKLQNFINQNYNSINYNDNVSDQVNNLYYTIILDEMNNNYHITCETKLIQNVVDNAIKSLAFDEYISDDIIISRKVLEIVMDLQIHDVDIHINNSQINIIRNGFKKATENEDVINSVLITDLSLINNILDANLLESSLLDSVYSSLTLNGGSKAIMCDEYPTDIYSTYCFFVCFERNNNYNNLAAQKKYVKSLRISEGVYSNRPDDNSYVNLDTILFGNSIMKKIIGGDKK